MPDVDEVEQGDAVEVATENARRKAEAVGEVMSLGGPSLRGPQSETIVLGVDTVVSLGDRLYGKPRDAGHAKEMLQALSDAEHTVVSGLAIRRGGTTEVRHDATQVRFRAVEPLLQWYLEHEEWRERAGAYAIQGRGAAFVHWIRGDYLNVVGLPVGVLLDLWPEVLKVTR